MELVINLHGYSLVSFSLLKGKSNIRAESVLFVFQVVLFPVFVVSVNIIVEREVESYMKCEPQ